MKSTDAITLLAVLAACLLCGVAGAAPRPLSPATQAVVTTAEAAFKAGEFARASELYEQAWKSAQDDTTLLYNAGRCAHLGAKLARAEALFVQYLGLSGQEEKFLAKAKGYLADVRAAMADERADQAKQAADRGAQLQAVRRYREAASEYAEAFRLDERQLRWLVLAGEAASLACDVAVARRHLELAALKAGPDSPEGLQAKQRLATLDTDCTAKPPEPELPTESDTRWGPLAVVGAGALAAVGSGVLYAAGSSEYDRYVKPDPPGQLSAEDRKNFELTRSNNNDSIEANYFFPSKVLGGLGAAAVVAGGLWWWLGKPSAAPAVAVSPCGVTVAWRL